jgi:hypothetical protein
MIDLNETIMDLRKAGVEVCVTEEKTSSMLNICRQLAERIVSIEKAISLDKKEEDV